MDRAHPCPSKSIKRTVVALVVASACVAPAVARASRPNDGKIGAVVSILPQEYFVERVGGARVEVMSLVAAGQSPHSYEPTPKQLAQLSDATIYFTIGVPFEKRLRGKIAATHKTLTIVDTHDGVQLNNAASEGRSEHESEGDGHEHDHEAGESDPHIWLNPRNVKTIARNICEALKKVAPEYAAEFDENLAAFIADLDRVDAKIARALAPLKGREFLVFHPAFGHFGDAYGLKQVAVETGGKQPSARQLAKLIDRAKATGVKVVFVQPQFARSSAQSIARAIDGVVVPMDPLARDYLKNLEEMAEKIAKIGSGPRM